jgi:hypothetical protein
MEAPAKGHAHPRWSVAECRPARHIKRPDLVRRLAIGSNFSAPG